MQICEFHLTIIENFIFNKFNINFENNTRLDEGTLNCDYPLMSTLDYVEHLNKTYSPKALNLLCDSELFNKAFEISKSNALLKPIEQLIMLTTFVRENNSSLDAQFLKKSFKEIEQFNETYFKTFSKFPHKDISFEKAVQTGFDTIFLIVTYRLISLSTNYNQQDYNQTFLIGRFKEIEQFNKTFYETFSSFNSPLTNVTFEVFVQGILKNIFVSIMEPYTSIFLELNQQKIDDKFLIKVFKELEQFNETHFKTFSRIPHGNTSFNEIVSKIMDGILSLLLNRVIAETSKCVNTLETATSKLSAISRKFEEATNVKTNRDRQLEYAFQSLIEESKIIHKMIEKSENELNILIEKLNIIKNLNKNRFTEVSRQLNNINKLLERIQMNNNIKKNQNTIFNAMLQGNVVISFKTCIFPGLT